MAERQSEPEVWVEAGSERLLVRGRAAAIVGFLVTHRAKLEAMGTGQLVADFTHDQLKCKLTESWPTVHLSKEWHRPPQRTDPP